MNGPWGAETALEQRATILEQSEWSRSVVLAKMAEAGAVVDIRPPLTVSVVRNSPRSLIKNLEGACRST
jgi:hypothetical protein